MIEQLPLEGFEHLHAADVSNLRLFRRKSDRQSGRSNSRPATRFGDAPYASTGEITVRVFTLGRFSLLLDGAPAEFGRKAPSRPLELLKTIIARGGRDITTSSLTAVLWPDVDGDTAMRSFDTTLHRLRKILVDDRVLVLEDGKLSLNARYCWVDIWEFERLLGKAQRILKTDTTDRQVFTLQQVTKSLINLYQNHFLSTEDMASWSVSTRERLRSKFIHGLLEIGRYWEAQGNWEQARHCYHKGLDVDDLVEVFYQRLMVCYLKLQRCSEGMSVYRRGQQVLSVVLGLQPEPETESLYLELKNARLKVQSA